ncbi:CLUMA_CG020541, isoform A [Clunio marinus]|uniref:CLUMA_CG020541, isoform A n=1 Tax=Clunio marinus TaxID=568069 RepID=A0A1J1J597_9DIPT|nr:CLUMA_CG020541, isoform A [Clunio marinus]
MTLPIGTVTHDTYRSSQRTARKRSIRNETKLAAFHNSDQLNEKPHGVDNLNSIQFSRLLLFLSIQHFINSNQMEKNKHVLNNIEVEEETTWCYNPTLLRDAFNILLLLKRMSLGKRQIPS